MTGTVSKNRSSDPFYQLWIDEFESRYENAEPLAEGVKISVVVPVYNVEDELLIECIESVRQQTYKNWELILVDDCSPWESVRKVLEQYQDDPRIRVILRRENGGISRATNDGIAAVTGTYIAFMDCDDVMAPFALNAVAELVQEHPDYDFIYSDEDKLSSDGKWRREPFFKPDWSPDTFLAMNYTNHLSVFRAELVRKVGGLRPAFDGSQDYDMTFRILAQTDRSRIGHIDKVLYHWRERAGSTSEDIEAKPYALKANQAAKEDALKRLGVPAHTEYSKRSYQFNVIYDLPEEPLISIIIPSKDNCICLSECLESIFTRTAYKNYEIILVDNGSSEENVNTIRREIAGKPVKYVYEKRAFNFSHMCNLGAAHAKGDLLLFLNDDIEVLEPEWLTRMAGQAMRPYTGAVGAKLMYPNLTSIQHCGVLSLPVGPSHALAMMNDDGIQSYYFGRNILNYNYIAVTGACLMIRKEVFHEVGEFAEDLAVAYNDVDLCFRLYEHGYYNVCRNDVVLIHKESVSRGYDSGDNARLFRMNQELRKLCDRHPDLVKRDPFSNQNLSAYAVDFSIKIDDTESGREYSEAQLIRSPEGEMKPDMAIRIIRTLPCKTWAIFGWMTTGDYAMDHEGTFHMLLGAGGGRVLKVPVVRPLRAEKDQTARDKSGQDGFYFLCRLDDHLFWRERHRIGMAVDYHGVQKYCWTDTYLTKPGYICHRCWPLPKGTIASIPEKPMKECVDNFRLDKGAFQISGWSFIPGDLYNSRFAFRLFLETADGREYRVNVDRMARLDVCRLYSGELNLLYCGYRANSMVPGDMTLDNTKVYLVFEDMSTGEKRRTRLRKKG